MAAPNVTTTSQVLTVSDNNPDGALAGSTSTEKWAVLGGSPRAQYATLAAVTTTASTSTTPVGFTTTNQADAVVTAVNYCLAALKGFGMIASS